MTAGLVPRASPVLGQVGVASPPGFYCACLSGFSRDQICADEMACGHNCPDLFCFDEETRTFTCAHEVNECTAGTPCSYPTDQCTDTFGSYTCTGSCPTSGSLLPHLSLYLPRPLVFL